MFKYLRAENARLRAQNNKFGAEQEEGEDEAEVLNVDGKNKANLEATIAEYDLEVKHGGETCR